MADAKPTDTTTKPAATPAAEKAAAAESANKINAPADTEKLKTDPGAEDLRQAAADGKELEAADLSGGVFAEKAAELAEGPRTYYLKAGASHSYIKNGEMTELTEPNSEVVLTEGQYEAFKDKFLPEPVNVPKPKAEEAAEDKDDA